MNPRFREALFVIQFVGNIVVLGVIVALLFAAANNVGRTAEAQTQANRQILDHLQRVFINHAIASTKQNCAVASEIAFLVESSPLAPPKLIHRVNRFVHDACRVEVVPPLSLDPNPTPLPTFSLPPGTSSPQPSGSPSPTSSPTSSPTPTVICLPGDLGCI